jgi:hypothetical protein
MFFVSIVDLSVSRFIQLVAFVNYLFAAYGILSKKYFFSFIKAIAMPEEKSHNIIYLLVTTP